MVHIYNGILLSHKKEWGCVICGDVDGPGDCHTKWSQKEKQIIYQQKRGDMCICLADSLCCSTEIDTAV